MQRLPTWAQQPSSQELNQNYNSSQPSYLSLAPLFVSSQTRSFEMKPSLFFSSSVNLCILLLFLISQASSAVDFHFQNCIVPATCGGLNITFPFFISGQQESYCGLTGFNITCVKYPENEDYPTLVVAGINYLVHNISYQDQTVVVSNHALSFVSNLNASVCIPYVRNLSLPTEQYELVENQKQIVLLYICNSSLVDVSFSKYRIGCYDQGGRTNRTSVLALPSDRGELLANVSGMCGREVVTPVEDYESNAELDVGEVLRGGFKLKWIASSCSECSNSGGKCGFDLESFHFRCFCPDRPRMVSCLSAGGVRLSLKLAVGLGAAGLVIVLVAVFCYKMKMSDKSTFFWMNTNHSGELVKGFMKDHGPLQVKRYRYLDVKKMTNSFKEKLGQGGYGGVYKGKLKEGCLVAVKILNRSKGNGEEFMNEVAAISRTSHVNIVSLLGFCFEGSKRALIYEFMPNGSLEKFIFDVNKLKKDDHLGWEALEKISIGIARGLEYLHRGCNTRILHFDIKPHNILLNEDFLPKIADFGLAKICNGKESIVSMTGARGTAGYIAPEVFCRNFGGVSHKSDVYSYGMMLSKMTGGRRNINVEAENSSEIYFPQYIYKRLELGEDLGVENIKNEEDKMRARKMIIVSLWCIQTNPSSRPSMKQVIEMLEGSVELEIPPKPYLSSPPKSPAHSSSTVTSTSSQMIQ